MRFMYSEQLAHLIYAAADILLVPSMFEPCGLTQVRRGAAGGRGGKSPVGIGMGSSGVYVCENSGSAHRLCGCVSL
jgi:hypothetical protein